MEEKQFHQQNVAMGGSRDCGDCVYRTGSIEPSLRDPIDKVKLVAESIYFRVQVGKGHLMSCISLTIRTWEKNGENGKNGTTGRVETSRTLGRFSPLLHHHPSPICN